MSYVLFAYLGRWRFSADPMVFFSCPNATCITHTYRIKLAKSTQTINKDNIVLNSFVYTKSLEQAVGKSHFIFTPQKGKNDITVITTHNVTTITCSIFFRNLLAYHKGQQMTLKRSKDITKLLKTLTPSRHV